MAFVLLAAACSDDTATTTRPTTTTTTAPPVTTTPDTTTTTATTTTASATTAPATTTTQPVRTALITSLPDGPCTGLGEPPAFGDADVTFQVGQRLYAASADGQAVRCLLEIPEDEASVLFPPELRWGEAADRLILGEHAYLASGEFITGFPAFSTLRWTKPTGTSVLAIEGERLLKGSIQTGAAKDVTFLARHDLAVYHPAGVEILSVGENAAGDYGIFLASNTGTNVRQVVDGTGATVTELGFLYDGFTLYFIAVHDDGTSHLHEFALFLPDDVLLQRTIRPSSMKRRLCSMACGSHLGTSGGLQTKPARWTKIPASSWSTPSGCLPSWWACRRRRSAGCQRMGSPS